jgi:hypothetical protein
MDGSIHEQGREADRRNSSAIWFAEECLNNGVRLESYVQSAERQGDQQLAEFFRRAVGESHWVQAGDRHLTRLRHPARTRGFAGA